MSLPKIAIIYLSYHSQPYFERAWKALQTLDYPRDRLEIIIVDNPHPEFGSSEKFIRERVQNCHSERSEESSSTRQLDPSATPQDDRTRKCLETVILPQSSNLGFAGGNNVGIKMALEQGCDYVYLHNQDGFVEPGTVRKLVEAMEQDKTIGAAQSLIMLYPEINLVNTLGNAYHYLGFGYSQGLRERLSDQTSPRAPLLEERVQSTAINNSLSSRRGIEGEVSLATPDIGYASGASLMLRSDLLRQHGLLDEDFFAYHEDLEYSLRLKSLGYKIVVVPASKFYHEYSFIHNKNKYYLMERNRFATILMYYKLPTIILLLPIAIVVEMGLCLFALQRGWIKEKLLAYQYWLMPHHWGGWLKKRQMIQKQRTVSDHVLLKQAVGKIMFDDSEIKNSILKYFANPLMSAYWGLVKKVIVW
ncbi:MAG: glycosyltransferase family 2 protein [Candidatus Magasanikbacteria bacterium]|nr:glycosyltransferase family 2 protein [Candidatus Magasanikbacteria bacterium]